MKTTISTILSVLLALPLCGYAQENATNPTENVTMNATNESWDKVFPLSEKVTHAKASFKNHFGITLVADVHKPKSVEPGAKLPGIAVAGPFGAVKEQVSGLYAMRLAERGFVTVTADPSFMGESGGEPRGVNSPDLNVEDFQAAVDYLTTRPDVDANRLGIVGICGWGGFGLQTAQIDTRIRATAIITMYDMTRVYAGDYNDAKDNESARFAKRKALSDRRTTDARNGTYARTEGFPNPVPADAPQFLKDYFNFYCTPRGYHPRSIGSNGGWLVQTGTSLQNTRLLAFASEIRSPVLMVHGEKAHSRYFSEGAFEKMTGQKPTFADGKFTCKVGNKELLLVPGAVHCDLYDERAGVIPWDTLDTFFKENLK